MTLRMTLRTRTLVAVIGLWLAVGSARAGPDEFDAVRAQWALEVGDVKGHVPDSTPAASPGARALAWFRDASWRPVPPGDPRATLAGDDGDPWLSRVRELARIGRAPTIPETAAGTIDPFPVLTALVLDRRRREREGLHSTRAEGPLARLAGDEAMAYFLDQWVPGAYGGPSAIPERRAAPAPGANLRDDARRNVGLAIGAILGLVALAAMGGLVLGRKRAASPDGA